MASLDGRVALVTGASRGIGRAIALALAREGARVAINYRVGEVTARLVADEIVAARTSRALVHHPGSAESQAAADEVSTRVRTGTLAHPGVGDIWAAALGKMAFLARADVSDSEQARQLITRVVYKWGRLDILVNNAGIVRDRTLRKLTDADWQAVIDTNLSGAFYCSSAAIPAMIDQGYGRIVNIASVIGQAGNVGQSNYAAASAGMIAFTKSAALELAGHNITVNAVCPGFTDTDMVAGMPGHIQDQIKARIPLGRFGRPEEIGRAVLFLVVDGSYITGQQININGGLYM